MTWKWSGEPGLDLHEALRVACKTIAPVNSYLEIGVDGGGSLNTVLCEGIPKRIVLCDIWNPEYCNHGDSKPHVLEVLKFFEAEAQFLDGDSHLLIPTLRETFDLVLVDGDHSADGAWADLISAWPLVNRGGMLVMDDINHPNYPWMAAIFNLALQEWERESELIAEERGGCNAAIVRKL